MDGALQKLNADVKALASELALARATKLSQPQPTVLGAWPLRRSTAALALAVAAGVAVVAVAWRGAARQS